MNVSKSSVAQDWALFAASNFVDPDYPELGWDTGNPELNRRSVERAIELGDQGFYYSFGQVMEKLSKNRNTPDDWRNWISEGPSGTECRMWFRAFHFAAGYGSDYAGIVCDEGLDGPRLRRMVTIIGEVLDK